MRSTRTQKIRSQNVVSVFSMGLVCVASTPPRPPAWAHAGGEEGVAVARVAHGRPLAVLIERHHLGVLVAHGRMAVLVVRKERLAKRREGQRLERRAPERERPAWTRTE